MPLTVKGKKILKNMVETYGSSKKGEEVFYASINKGKAGSSKWHRAKKKRFHKSCIPTLAPIETYHLGDGI